MVTMEPSSSATSLPMSSPSPSSSLSSTTTTSSIPPKPSSTSNHHGTSQHHVVCCAVWLFVFLFMASLYLVRSSIDQPPAPPTGYIPVHNDTVSKDNTRKGGVLYMVLKDDEEPRDIVALNDPKVFKELREVNNKTFTPIIPHFKPDQLGNVPGDVILNSFLMADPEYHLAYCLVPGQLGIMMRNVNCALTQDPVRHNCTHGTPYKSHEEMENESPQSIDKLLFIRQHPVERFVTVFMDRCIQKQRECFGCRNNFECVLQHLVYTYLTVLIQPRRLTVDEVLFVPQTWLCALNYYPDKFTLIDYNSPSFLSDTKDFFRHSNVSDDRLSRMEGKFKQFVPLQGPKIKNMKKFIMNKIKYTYRLKKLVHLLYDSDYKILNITKE